MNAEVTVNGRIFEDVDNASRYNLDIKVADFDEAKEIRDFFKGLGVFDMSVKQVVGETGVEYGDVDEETGELTIIKPSEPIVQTQVFEELSYNNLELVDMGGEDFVAKIYFREPSEVDRLRQEIAALKSLLLDTLKGE